MRTQPPCSLVQQGQRPELKSLLEYRNFVPAEKQPVHGPGVPEIDPAHRKFEKSGLMQCRLRNADDQALRLETGPIRSYLMINLVARSPTRSGHVADLMTPDVRASFSPWPLLFLPLPISATVKERRFSPALFVIGLAFGDQ